MMKIRVPVIAFAVFALAISYFLHFYLPKLDVVTISGIDTKRAEGIPARGDTPTDQILDLYFIYVNDSDGKPRIYRNENTAWGWPLYFKFDAADLQAKAQSLAGRKVLIKYYGWRNKYLNLFPNIVTLEEAAEDASLTPWGRHFVFGAWIFLLILIFPRYLAMFMKKKEKQ